MIFFQQSFFNFLKNNNLSFTKWVISFFLLISGISALIYQVLWVRLLSLSIGSTSVSISTVLAAFFLGLGLGSYFSGYILKRFKNRFKVYLYIEIAIAFSAIMLLPILLNLDYYISLLPINEAGLVLRFFIVMLLLLIPTFLMGATFPILVSIVIVKKSEMGTKLAHLYAFNTIGAVIGALLSGIVFIPYYGLDGTLYIAASLNIFIVFIGLVLYKHFNEIDENQTVSSTKDVKKLNNKALIVLFVTGLSAMATEVGWMKFLIVYTGNTIYGFSLILSMFLTGLAIGSWLAKSQKISKIDPEKFIFFMLIALSMMLLFARVGLGLFPEINEQLNSLQVNDFVYRWSKYLVMFLLLLPATLLFGALFPITLNYYTSGIDDIHSDVGRAYGVNIIAGIFGSVLAGFLIIPYFSTDVLLTSISLLVLVCSFIFIQKSKVKNIYIFIGSSIFAFSLLSHFLPHIDYRSMINIVVSRAFKNSTFSSKPIFSYVKEGETGIISLMYYEQNRCIVKLQNNGMSESYVDVCNENNLIQSEFLLGEMPYLLNAEAKKAFVVGYGGGTTVRALSMNDLDSIDVVELEPAVLDAMRTLYDGKLPTDVDNRVNITVNDARNTLLMSDNYYDIIVSQPSHPWLAGASNIMNKDFFEIVKSRLSEDGIYAQWVPLFKIDVATLKSIIRAYTDTFEHVISFVNLSSRDFLMFASNKPIVFDYETIAKQMQEEKIAKVFKRYNIDGPYDLMRLFALSRDQLVDISSSSEPATDTNLLAETFYARYNDVEGNSFDTVGFIKKYLVYDIESYLGEQSPQKLYEQQYFFLLNGYKKEAKHLQEIINKR